MAALAEFAFTAEPHGYVPIREDRLSFKGLSLPVVLKLAAPMSETELIAFSRENKAFRIESNANGELEIMSPVGYEGDQREIFVGSRLYNWSEEYGGVCIGANAGCRLGQLQVRSPDVGWISEERDRTLTKAEKRGFLPFAPDFLIEIRSESDRCERSKTRCNYGSMRAHASRG